MRRVLLPIFILCIALLSSCKDKSDGPKGDLITKKILYDVPVVNLQLEDRTVNNPNWFWENLPYPDGDGFIDKLYADARDGKIPLYYYDMEGDYEHLERIPKKDVERMFAEEMTVSLPVPDFYDETTNTFVQRPNVDFLLDAQHIHKLRFLEEWYDDDGMIVKKVLAVAPVFTINIVGNDAQEGYVYNTVKFWVMADEKLLK